MWPLVPLFVFSGQAVGSAGLELVRDDRARAPNKKGRCSTDPAQVLCPRPLPPFRRQVYRRERHAWQAPDCARCHAVDMPVAGMGHDRHSADTRTASSEADGWLPSCAAAKFGPPGRGARAAFCCTSARPGRRTTNVVPVHNADREARSTVTPAARESELTFPCVQPEHGVLVPVGRIQRRLTSAPRRQHRRSRKTPRGW